MFLLRIVCVVSTVVVVIHGYIPSVLVDTLVYHNPTFETIIKESMAETKEKIDNIKSTSRIAGASLSLIPTIGSTAKGALESLVTSEMSSMWEEALIKSIADATHRTVASSKVDDIKSKIRAILHHFKNLKMLHQLTDADRAAIVHDIYNEIVIMTNVFIAQDSTFRKYPDLSIVPLSMLAEVTVTTYALLEDYVPSLANSTCLPCTVKTTLEDYKSRLTYSRFQRLEGQLFNDIENHFPQKGCRPYSLSDYIAEVLDRTMYWPSIDCDKICSCSTVCSRYIMHPIYSFEDRYTGIRYGTKSNNGRDCMASYMSLLKKRIDDAFNEPIELINSVCSAEKLERRQKTGKIERFSHIKVHSRCECEGVFKLFQ